jgi:hypothetical protein
MMSRTQITLDDEMQRRARRRASDLGVSLAEYFRRLVARDLSALGTPRFRRKPPEPDKSLLDWIVQQQSNIHT